MAGRVKFGGKTRCQGRAPGASKKTKKRPRGFDYNSLAAHYPQKGQPSILLVSPIYRLRSRHSGLVALATALDSKEFIEQVQANSDQQLYDPALGPPSFHVRILDLTLAPENFKLEAFLCRFNPTILGVTAMTPVYQQATQIARVAKAHVKGAFRLVGGEHASALPEQALVSSAFQGAVIGYGEETLTELALCLLHHGREAFFNELARIKGLAYKDRGGQVVINERRANFVPLDNHPFAHQADPLLVFRGYPEEFEGTAAYTLTSRGCAHRCSYCSGHVIHQRRISFRSIESVGQELDQLRQQGVKIVSFRDEDFAGRQARAVAIAKKVPAGMEWIMMTRLDRLSIELLQQLSGTGLRKISCGIETGDLALAQQVKNDQSINFKDMLEIRQEAGRLGIGITYYFMTGLPGQDWRSILKTARLLREHQPTTISVFDFQPFPGSQLYEKLQREEGLTVQRRSGWELTPATTELTAEEIMSARYDLEYLGYLVAKSQHVNLKQRQMFGAFMQAVMHKVRIQVMYDLLVNSVAQKGNRHDVLRKLRKSADAVFAKTFRQHKDFDNFAMLGAVDDKKLTVLEQYEDFERVMQITMKTADGVLDPFLTSDVKFENCFNFACLDFPVLKLLFFICAVLVANLKYKHQSEVVVIRAENDRATAPRLYGALRDKTAAECTRPIGLMTAEEFAPFAREEEELNVMGIPFRYDPAKSALIIPA